MSSLWSQIYNKITNITIQQNPSPNHTKTLKRQAHAVTQKFHYEFHKIIHDGKDSIKEISLHIFHLSQRGSMTVEAAICLPLFLFFFLNLLSSIEMIRLHGNLQVALRETGNKLSLYGYCAWACAQENEGESGELLQEVEQGESLVNIAMSYIFVKNDVVNQVGKKYLKTSPLVMGADGLQFVGSDLMNNEEEIEIRMTYCVAAPFSIVFVKPFLLENCYYAHAWNGYHIPGTDENATEIKYYYVAAKGEVFHEKRDCSHLKITKKKVDLAEVFFMVNRDGEKYTACEICKGKSKEVWITDWGEKYHFNENCPGIKRTIYVITKEETGKYRPCKTCVINEKGGS